jgi:hypothetical protein
VSRRDDPVERNWERRIDRAAQDRVRKDDIRRIRGEADIRDADRHVARARSALEWGTAWRHIVEERDALAQRIADCAWLDNAVQQRWAESIDELGSSGAGPASVVWLSEDIADVCATLRQDLTGIAEVLGRDKERQDDDGVPALVALYRARGEARSQVVAVRTRIGSSAHLNAEIRDKWLSELPEPDEGLSWLTSTGSRTVASLRREVIDLSETVARFASRMRGGLTVIKVELEKL